MAPTTANPRSVVSCMMHRHHGWLNTRESTAACGLSLLSQNYTLLVILYIYFISNIYKWKSARSHFLPINFPVYGKRQKPIEKINSLLIMDAIASAATVATLHCTSIGHIQPTRRRSGWMVEGIDKNTLSCFAPQCSLASDSKAEWYCGGAHSM